MNPIVGHGATAAQALLSKDFRVTQHRGKPMASEQEFFQDLISVARYLDGKKAKVAGPL